MYCANGVVVNAATRLLPDQTPLIHHLETIAEHADFAPLVVVPSNRNLFQLQSRAKRQVQQFNVKPKPIDSRCLDKRPAHAHTKSFEAALRVPERQSRG